MRNYWDELLHVGKIGLYEAYKSYNPAKNNGVKVKFWSYAQRRVKGSMFDFISKQSNLIRPSRMIEKIVIKIMKMNLERRTPIEISKELSCSEWLANQALAFLQIKHVDSLNKPMSYTHDEHTLELGDLIPSITDFSRFEEEDFWNRLNNKETVFLRLRLLGYSLQEAQQLMAIDTDTFLEIERSLKQKGKELDGYYHFSKGDGSMEVNEGKRPELTKTEFLKHKKNGMLEKDICKNYEISKNKLIKYKQSWGLAQSRIKKINDKTISIAAAPKNIDSEHNKSFETELLELRNMVSTLKVRISELESEREVWDVKRENEREAFWIVQDFLRAEVSRLKTLLIGDNHKLS